MSLRNRANGVTRLVNPNTAGTIYVSDGYTTDDAGDRAPAYDITPGVAMQVQPLSPADLKLIDSLNIQNVQRAVFLDGRVDGVRRLTNQGGDILWFNGSFWLVTVVLEPWDGSKWMKVGVTEQVDLPAGVSFATVCSQAVFVAIVPGE